MGVIRASEYEIIICGGNDETVHYQGWYPAER